MKGKFIKDTFDETYKSLLSQLKQKLGKNKDVISPEAVKHAIKLKWFGNYIEQEEDNETSS